MNSSYLKKFVKEINDIEDEKLIHNYYREQAVNLKEDVYNFVVILLTMSINKEIAILLDRNEEAGVVEYPYVINNICEQTIDVYKEINLEIYQQLNIDENDKKTFLEYLNDIVKRLVSGVKYIESKDDEQNEQNTRFRREERIRDNMKYMLTRDKMKKLFFSIDKHIEIPFLYILAWDLPKLFENFNDNKYGESSSYLNNLKSNISYMLRYVSDELLDILVYGGQMDKTIYENGMVDSYNYVDFSSLLPTIKIVEKVDYNHDYFDYRFMFGLKRTEGLPLIKKEILKKIPLLPMETEKNLFEPVKAMKMMINLILEENKTKEYQLSSDIICLSKCISEICNQLIAWIGQDLIPVLENKESSINYIFGILKSAMALPRTDSESNKEVYLEKLLESILTHWDYEHMRSCKNCGDIEYSYFSVLKLSRNWKKHIWIDRQVYSVEFIVFSFINSIRYLVNLHDSKWNYEDKSIYWGLEAKLFRFLGEEKVEYTELDINELKDEYINTYKYVDDNKGKIVKIKGDTPHDILTAAGDANSEIKEKMSESEIFLSFWLNIHNIHMLKHKNEVLDIKITRDDIKDVKKLSRDDIKDENLIVLLEKTFSLQKKSILIKKM